MSHAPTAAAPDVLEEHNAVQRQYFEGTLKRTMVPEATPYVQRQVSELLAFAGLSKGDRILEVGCGMGRYTLELARRGYEVEGLDLSPVLLEALRRYQGEEPALPLHAMDILEAPEKLGDRFDAVVGFFTLHHLHDLDACFAAMARLVRKGGTVAFLEPNPWNLLYYLQILFTPRMTFEGDGGIVEMRRGRIRRASERAGLVDFRLERFGFFPPRLANRPWGQRWERRFESFPPFAGVLPFQLFGARRP